LLGLEIVFGWRIASVLGLGLAAFATLIAAKLFQTAQGRQWHRERAMQTSLSSTMIGAFVLALLCAVMTSRGIVLDGLRDAEYGPPVALQTLKSSVRSNDVTQQIVALYARSSPTKLHLFVAGNMDRGVMKLHLFFSGPLGEHTLTERSYDDSRARKLAGLTFDATFRAQYHLFARMTGNGSYAATWVDRAAVPALNPTTIHVPVVNESTTYAGEIAGTDGKGRFFADNDITRTGGVGFNATGTDPVENSTKATEVDNGWEFELAMTPHDIDTKVVVMLGKDDHSEMYNHFLPALPRDFALPNVTSAVLNLSAIPGDQFVVVSLSHTTTMTSLIATTATSVSATPPTTPTILSSSIAFVASSSAMPAPFSAAPLIGGVVGGAVAFALVVGLACVVLKRQRTGNSAAAAGVVAVPASGEYQDVTAVRAPPNEYDSSFAALT
jgi:hypothetical protein